MKKLYFLMVAMLVATMSFGQTTVFQESFETGNSGTPSETCNDGSDFFTRTDGSDINNYSVTGVDGSYFFAAQDTDGSPCTMAMQTLVFDDIDISTYTNLTLAVLLAEDDSGDGNEDWDAGDLFYVEVDYDNSGTFTKVLQFAVNAGSGFNVSPPSEDSNLDGVGEGTALTNEFAEFTASLNTGSVIDVRLVFDGLAAGDEDIAVDNIRIIDGFVACEIDLGEAAYTCLTNTTNVDNVNVTVPYTGMDANATFTTTSGGTITDNNGSVTITGLEEGQDWDVVISGGNCDGVSVSGTIPATECDPTPNSCIDLSGGTDTFEIVTVAMNSDMDMWTNNSGSFNLNGYCGGGCNEETNGWLVLGPLDTSATTHLALLFDATEGFSGTDLNVQYTTDYSALCPDGATWTSVGMITDAGTEQSIDLSAAATNAEIFIGIQYLDNDGFSNWTLSNLSLASFDTCPSLGTQPTSACATCDLTLQTAAYVCSSNTEGDNNDEVVINIPYTGMEGTITSITTTSAAVIGGNDPITEANGTITLTGLSEGDAWDLTINGGDCDATTISGTVPAAECDPTAIVINEINADPSNNANNEGDANGDGTANFRDDEFVEFYNVTGDAIDLTGYTIEVNGTLRHTFTAVSLPASSFITVFGGGTPTSIPGLTQVSNEGTSGLSLSNGGATITLKDDTGTEVVSFDYSGLPSGNNQSIARSPDFDGPFVEQSSIIAGVLFSPGLENDDPTLSTAQFDAASVFAVYPNPTNNGFVNIVSKNNAAISVSVYSILGKQVINNVTPVNNRLDVSNLNAGLYMLQITQNGASITKKLVIK